MTRDTPRQEFLISLQAVTVTTVVIGFFIWRFDSNGVSLNWGLTVMGFVIVEFDFVV